MPRTKRTSSVSERYADLKAEGFRLLRSNIAPKGDIRAYLGLMTWIHEREAIGRGVDEEEAHGARLKPSGSAFKVVRMQGLCPQAQGYFTGHSALWIVSFPPGYPGRNSKFW